MTDDIPRLVIDANQLVSDYKLHSAPWRILLQHSADGECHVCVPEVVVREVVGCYRADLKEELKQRRGLKLLCDLDEAFAEFRYKTVDVDATAAAYEEDLRHTLRMASVNVPEPDPAMLLRLTDRAIARRRPFNDKGHGFRDSVVWEHTLAELVDAPSAEVILVSADGVFTNTGGTGLNDALQAELDDRHESVALLRAVASFVEDRISEVPTVHAAVLELFNKERAQVEINISNALLALPIEVVGAYGEGAIRGAHVTSSAIVKSVPDPADPDIVVLFVKAEVQLSVEVDAYDPRDQQRIYGFHNVVDQTVSLTATYRRSTAEIDNFAAADVGVVGVMNGNVF